MMKISKEKFYLSFFLIFLPLLFMSTNVSASNMENQTWSFDFKDCTISDALRQISSVMNIEILASRGGYEELNRSYQDQTVDYILRDIFRKESCAMIWRYGDSGLASIDIWVFKGDGGGSFRQEKLAKQGGVNIRGNRVKKITDSKPTIVRKESPNIRKNGSFLPQKNPKDQMNLSKEAPAAMRNKGSGGGSRGKSYSPTRLLSEAGESPGIELKATEPPPMPEKLHGLEPPPMPPGFSD
jgi:hypothetical protein